MTEKISIETPEKCKTCKHHLNDDVDGICELEMAGCMIISATDDCKYELKTMSIDELKTKIMEMLEFNLSLKDKECDSGESLYSEIQDRLNNLLGDNRDAIIEGAQRPLKFGYSYTDNTLPESTGRKRYRMIGINGGPAGPEGTRGWCEKLANELGLPCEFIEVTE